MKKLFVYAAVSILLLQQACNNNSASKNITDSTGQESTTNDSTLNQTNNIIANQDTGTLNEKKATRINADEVPASVIAAFNSKYPDVTDAKWLKGDNKKGKTFYRVRWQANGKKMMSMFRSDGSFIKDKQLN